MDKKTHNRLLQYARKISRYWTPRNTAKEKCKIDVKLYECSKCGKYCYEGESKKNFAKYVEKYPDKEVSMERFDMDHIVPVVDVYSTSHDWNEYYQRLFCPEDNYRGLCSTKCHAEKTKAENKVRLAVKYGKKK